MADTRTRDQTTAAGVQMREGGMPQGQAPAVRQARPMTATQQAAADARNARDYMLADIENNKSEIIKFLAAFKIDYDFFLAGLKTFFMRTLQTDPDFFLKVTPTSFMEALFRCAKDGLIPDGKEAAIGHFKEVATYMPMRDGLVKVLWRTGMIKDINDEVVTKQENERGWFKYVSGDSGYIEHQIDLDREDSHETVAAYCIINLVTGGTIREVVRKADLEKIAKMSRSPARGSWKFQMDRKAAIRRVMGKMPREAGVAQVLAHDDLNYDEKLLEEDRREGRLPSKSLFADRAVVRRPKDPPVQQQTGDGDSPPIEDEESTGDSGGGGDPAFKLQAIITTRNGVQEFGEDADFWVGEISNKMRSLKDEPEKLGAFWEKNLSYVNEAGLQGYAVEAMKLIHLAQEMGLPGAHS